MFFDGWKSYDGSVDFGYKSIIEFIHSKEEYASKTLEITGEKMLGVNNQIKQLKTFGGFVKCV